MDRRKPGQQGALCRRLDIAISPVRFRHVRRLTQRDHAGLHRPARGPGAWRDLFRPGNVRPVPGHRRHVRHCGRPLQDAVGPAGQSRPQSRQQYLGGVHARDLSALGSACPLRDHIPERRWLRRRLVSRMDGRELRRRCLGGNAILDGQRLSVHGPQSCV